MKPINNLDDARQIAAQAWCQEITKKTEMDADLCEAVAHILFDVVSGERQPPLRAVPGCRCCEILKEGKATIRIQWSK